MANRSRKAVAKAGAAPGTLVHTGEQKIEQVRITVLNYNETTARETVTATIDQALTECDGSNLTWLNVDGLHDTDLIAQVGRHFAIHPLTQEDILTTAQRPKWEDFGEYIYVVLQMLRYHPDSGQVVSEQISLVLTARVLISFQECEGDLFAPVRERLHKGQGRIRASGSDYLAYTLIDAVVDHYFIILEQVGLEIDDLEEEILDHPEPKSLQRLHDLKREVFSLRKQVWPLREVITGLSRGSVALISPTTALFLRDVYDHAIQVIDTIESYRELLSGLLDLYLTTISNKMNEIMKVLTIMSTIFIPLTFLAGVYGMNFKYMPELAWPWGYGLAWMLMIAVAACMLFYFKKKKWI